MGRGVLLPHDLRILVCIDNLDFTMHCILYEINSAVYTVCANRFITIITVSILMSLNQNLSQQNRSLAEVLKVDGPDIHC